MRFPEYPENFYNTEVTPLDVYIKQIGLTYRDDFASLQGPTLKREGNIIRASLLIGRACFLADKNPDLSVATAQQVQRELEPQIHTETFHDAAYVHYNIAQLVEDRDDPATINRVRHNMHHNTLEKLDHFMSFEPRSPKQRADARGARAQLRGEAFLSRIRHPWFLSVAALRHHDQSRSKPTNYDLVVSEAVPVETHVDETPEMITSFNRVQIKNGCFAECNLKTDPVRRGIGKNNLKGYRKTYLPNIKLLSGCCDFRIPETGESADHLLFEELDGTISEEGTRILDDITERVLFLATAPGEFTGRGGLYSTESNKLQEAQDLYSGMPGPQVKPPLVIPEPLLDETPEGTLQRLQARFNNDYHIKTP